jgi:hypothetical protein
MQLRVANEKISSPAKRSTMSEEAWEESHDGCYAGRAVLLPKRYNSFHEQVHPQLAPSFLAVGLKKSKSSHWKQGATHLQLQLAAG